MARYEYRFLHYEPDDTTDRIEKVLENIEGWDVISHSQTTHGMSVLIRRLKPKTGDNNGTD